MPTAKEVQNIEIVMKANAAENARDIQRIRDLQADDYFDEINGVHRSGEQSNASDDELFRAFPDYHRDFEQVLAVDDYVIVRWRIKGTHKDTFMGIPASNAQIDWTGCSIFKVVDEKLKEGRVFADTMTFINQLGVTLKPE